MSDDLRARLEEDQRIIEAATEGPWEVKRLEYEGTYYTRTIHAENSDLGRWSHLPPEIASTAKGSDAEFIGASRTRWEQANRALLKVLELHYPVAVYSADGECNFEPCDHPDAEHVEVASGDYYHADQIDRYACAACSPETDEVEHWQDYPCPTVTAIKETMR